MEMVKGYKGYNKDPKAFWEQTGYVWKGEKE